MSKAQLKKATITVLDGAEKGKIITVLFNPTEYSFERSNTYKATAVPGLGSPLLQFVSGESDHLSIDLFLDDVHVVVNGGRNPAYREEDGQRVMKQSEITVRVALGRGTAADTVWTCDFSHEYVSINADYRS